MSLSKTKIFTRTLYITSASYTGTGPYTYTIGFSTVHNLKIGDSFKVVFKDIPFEVTLTVATVVNTTDITVTVTSILSRIVNGTAIIGFYSSGMTGGQTPMSLPCNALPPVIQGVIYGTGGGTIVIEASNDGLHWHSIGTLTLTTSNENSQFLTVTAAWAFVRANITSIGASSTVVITRSV